MLFGVGRWPALAIAIVVTYLTWGAGSSMAGVAAKSATGVAANSAASAVAHKGDRFSAARSDRSLSADRQATASRHPLSIFSAKPRASQHGSGKVWWSGPSFPGASQQDQQRTDQQPRQAEGQR